MSAACSGSGPAGHRSRHSGPCTPQRQGRARLGLVPTTLLSGILALLWLLLRSGAKPSRLGYPCQQTAFATAALVFGPAFVAAFVAIRLRLMDFVRTTPGKVVASGVGVVSMVLIAAAAIDRGDKIAILPPPAGYEPEIFLVNEAGGVEPGRHGGVDDLIQLMGAHGFKWHRSATTGLTSGPEGLIGRDDFVLIKVNGQWGERGGTNADVVRGVVRQIVEHPDGFVGEILAVDNGQGSGSLTWRDANAEDRTQCIQDVVDEFAEEGWNISGRTWDDMRGSSVDEFSDGDMRDGYVVNSAWDPETRIKVSYPKFRTALGTCVSYKYGIWSEDSETYDREKLVAINIPVFKTHFIYGITACVKNHMGVVTRDLGTDSHNAIGRGGLGSFMAEVRPPDLNILDCTWILARPGSGPNAPYHMATRRDQLLASTDPVALDAWATKHIMVPQMIANGYDSYSDQDPDNPDGIFRRYLDLSMNELLAAGIETTNDYEAVKLYVWPGPGAGFFIRGDANRDRAFDISDPITTLLAHFLGQGSISCEDAADANDDGRVDVSDAVFSLEHLFLGAREPPPPFPEPGVDPSEDALGCES